MESPAVAKNNYFVAKDLDGQEWTSEKLFKGHKITMANIWATYCAPCINEMPMLEELSKKLDSEGYALVGIIADGETKKDDAKEIIKLIEITYPNVCLNSDLQKIFKVQVVPTTYFMDEEGNIIGEPIFGARNEQQYLYEIESHLALIK